MIVYGDAVGREDPHAKRAVILRLLRESAAAPAGVVRHQTLVAALIECGELAQAVIEARFLARGGIDASASVETALMAGLGRLAAAVGRSWDAGFAAAADPRLGRMIDGLPIPEETLEVRHPEGFAHYALYPEAYWAAARGLAPAPDAVVVGLRSIGTTLAATVAAALGAPPAVTVRPVGHPFGRRLSLAPDLQAMWAARPVRTHAVVDEGPGLSGSSFGAVADALERCGVAPEQLVFLPGHGGDLGREASPAHRQRWRGSRRPCVAFDDLTGPAAAPHQRLESWVADLVGAAATPPENLSGGRWRDLLVKDEADWPPVDAQNEKLKFLLRTGRGTFLLRFAGLGRRGLAKHEMSRRLAQAGFGIAPLGWRHGFMVEPWHEGARPLRAEAPEDRRAVLSRLPGYLAFRAGRLAADRAGATPAALLDMMKVNIAEGLGAEAADRLGRWTPAALAGLAAAGRPVLVDGRLHPWEWLALPGGAVLKADALDHHAAHDLIGAQDVAWDLAGAGVEWDLSEDETMILADAVGRRMGRGVDPRLLRFHALAYPAFQIGAFTLAAARAAGKERERLAARAAHYRTRIIEALEGSSTKL